MNFIKKVFSPSKPETSNKGSNVPSTIESNFKSSDVSLLHDYENANYYNFYRMLERKVSSNTPIGLVPKQPTPMGFDLKKFDIEAHMTDSCVVSVLTQEYDNNFTSSVEAQYKIPLPPNSAVSDFVVILKDKVLKGKIKEKSKAQEKYNDSIASGGKAFLAEKSDDGLFNLMIGNIAPKENVTIKLTITSEISTHLESYHYCLHSLMFPSNKKFDFNLTLHANLSTPIESVEMLNYKNSCQIEYENPEKTKLKLKYSNNGDIKKMIIIVLVPKLSEKPQSFIEYCPIEKNYSIGLNFYPNFNVPSDEIDQKSEYIFVVDCSGSMSGEPINQAKKALEICLKSLSENSKFNIYRFGSSFEKFETQSKIYNDETLEKAMNYIRDTDANLGGTELLPPIKDILNLEFDPEYPRQVFILTDGEVSERDSLIEYVARESNTTRIFTYGIGYGVDKELVIGLSQACKGYYELIKENEDMEEKVMKLLSVSFMPTLSNIKVDWGELSVEQSPSIVRPLFSNERMMIYGTLNKDLPANNGKITVNLIGDGPKGKPLTFPIELNFSKTDSKSSNNIHTLAALKQIQDLEEQERKQKKDHKDKIVELGQKYGLVSKHTSLVITVETEGEVNEDTMVSVNVVNEKPDVPSYYTSLAPPPPAYQSCSFAPPPPSIQCAPVPCTTSFYRSCSIDQDDCFAVEEEIEECKEIMCDLNELVSQQCETIEKCDKKVSYSTPVLAPSISLSRSKKSSSSSSSSPSSYPSLSSPAPSSSSDVVLDLIRQQKASGCFNRSSVESLIKVSASPKELSSNEDIWTTFIVIVTFTEKHASKKAQFDLIVQKATKYIKQQLNKLNLADKFDEFLKSAKSSI